MHHLLIALALVAVQDQPEEKLRTANGVKLAETASAATFTVW